MDWMDVFRVGVIKLMIYGIPGWVGSRHKVRLQIISIILFHSLFYLGHLGFIGSKTYSLGVLKVIFLPKN